METHTVYIPLPPPHRQGIQGKGAGHSGLDHKQEPFIICVNKTWQQKLQKD